jgi:hypothetical protein
MIYMPTERKPMSGRGQTTYPDKLDKYNKESKAKATGKFMRTFARTKTSKLITAWNDAEHFYVMNNYFYPLADSTGNVDSATTVSAQMETLLNAAWELYYENANLKDLVAAEEASWKLYFCAALFICTAIQIQYNYRCYLPAYTESDTTPGAGDAIPYFSQSSFDIFLASMKDFPINKGIYEIVDTFCTWVIELAKPYEAYTLRIPGCYLSPFNSFYDLADLEAARELMRVNWGNMLTHSKKFGLKLGKWRDPVKPTIKTLTDVDVIAFFCHVHIAYRDDGTDGSQELYPKGGFMGNNLTTEYTNCEYFFKDNPNESVLHLLAPFWGTYNATNNPYGGLLIIGAAGAGEYSLSLCSCAQHGTAVAVRGFDNDLGALIMTLLCKASTDNVVQDGDYDLKVIGANLTADQSLENAWPLDVINGLHFGTGRGATETNNDILNWFGRLLV